MEKIVSEILHQVNVNDVTTYEHSLRVGKLAKIMSLYLNFNPQQTYQLVVGCLLHDIGKIFIPYQILNKESALTLEEWESMKKHPILGANLAEEFGIENQSIIDIIKYHHERWDGVGYPFGLRADSIPIFARICSIIDAFDCMINDRPYRTGMSVQFAKEELWSQHKKQFDEKLVQIFLSIPEQDLKKCGENLSNEI